MLREEERGTKCAVFLEALLKGQAIKDFEGYSYYTICIDNLFGLLFIRIQF